MPKSPLDNDAVHEDLVTHLQARLGLEDEAATVATLGDWLSSYEPGPAALARATTRCTSASLPSRHGNAA
jgi:hypothetical protein